MAIPSVRDIFDLIKTGATIEAQEKIMELRLTALESQEDNIGLRNRVHELEAKVNDLINDTGEPCPKCRKKTWIVESSKPDPQLGELGVTRREYKCAQCGFTESALMTPK